MSENSVTAIPPASAFEARAHFARRLALETDCADVHDAMANAGDGDAGFVLLDVRGPAAYARSHVPGALSLPHREITAERMAEWPADTIFVVYCAGPHCNGADRAALRLAALGRPVKLMLGGMTGWADEGFSIAPKPSAASGQHRRAISSASPYEDAVGYARAVVLADAPAAGPSDTGRAWIFVSGTTGLDAAGEISPDPAIQAEQALRTIEHALAEAGATLADTARVRYILPDAADFARCIPILRARFGAIRPAATMIVAGLIDPRMRIEIEVTACRPLRERHR